MGLDLKQKAVLESVFFSFFFFYKYFFVDLVNNLL